jgi:hypothetical protein
VAVLNAKKEKIRELNEQLLRSEGSKKKSEEAEAESEDEFTDDEDNEVGDDGYKDDIDLENTEKGADEDSGATEILPADSPMDDISSKGISLSQSAPHNDGQAQGLSDVPVPTVRSNHQPIPTDAAMLLSGPTYTSAPRKRRHQ